MKKIFFTLIILLSITTYSQFTLATDDGTPINDNDVFTFNSIAYPYANLEFVVTNTAGNAIDVVITVETVTNTNGSLMELCFGLCYTGIVQGNSYPDTPYHLEAGASSEPHGNHFLNTADGSQVITYLFRFHEVDGSGNEIGTPLRVTYTYDPNAAVVGDFNQVNFDVFPTLVNNGLIKINTNEDLILTFIDSLGRIVKQENISANTNALDISDLNSQIYYIKAQNNQGLKTIKKIIVK